MPEEHLTAFRELYKEAFPKNEQFPFAMLLKGYRKGKVELLSLVDGKRFVGLMVTAEYGNRVLLNYFAVDGTSRGKGYGSSALALLKERIGKKHLFLDIELITADAPNVEQRKKRKAYKHLLEQCSSQGFRLWRAKRCHQSLTRAITDT